jgi:serine protease Do
MTRHQQILLAAAAVVLTILALLIGAMLGGGKGRGGDLASAAQTAAPAIVMLSLGGGQPNVAPEGGFGPDPNAGSVQLGSGFVISGDGLIVTSSRVVADLPVARAIFPDGISRQAQVIGRDDEAGIVLLKATPGDKPFAHLDFAAREPLLGQSVLLMGAPFGLNGTASHGIVSHAARKLDPSAPYGLIQTDAPLSAGGSGGPMLDDDGEVLGVAESGLSTSPGVAYAVPASIVKAAVERLKPKS